MIIHVQPIVVCLFFVISVLSTRSTRAASTGNETDRLALLAFKHSILQDPMRTMSLWNDSFHLCYWKGVTCDQKHQRVTRLVFISEGLVGSLSPFVGNLSFLQVLHIHNNSFHGEIPPQLGHLFRLQKLNLARNKFEGEIPANISRCSNLKEIDVSYNNLVGRLPKELGALSKLTGLHFHNNHLTGAIPPFIGNFTSLEIISASYNLFEGSIPDSIGQLKNMSFLYLGANNLSGMIPPSLFNLSMLTNLSLSRNQLQGSLPSSIGSMFPHLRWLQLSDNHLTGTLPSSLSNCSALQLLEISDNNLNGKIAIDFGRIKNIGEIFLVRNNFGSGEPDEMNFIGSASNCSNLTTLEVAYNKLRGLLPISIGNLSTQLNFLDFQGNHIYGTLPSTVGNLVNLSWLSIQGNQFTGTIPSTIGNLGKLEYLSLERNKFSGAIPNSLGNLSMLLELRMEMNQLEGIIPTSLGNCQRLLLLDLSQNNLRGPIPNQLFTLPDLSILLNLSRNHLDGTLSLDVGNLKNLGSLDLSKNNLSGEIPSSLGSCTSLENLFLQENVFQGSIPSSLSSLKGVINIDLSYNNLSGQIPRFFEQFSIEYLNLSFNNFEGEVPMRGVFANRSSISVVGNNKLCGGSPKLLLRKCSTKESMKRQGRTRALIIVITIISTLLFVSIMLYFLFCWHKKKEGTVKSFGPMLKEPFVRVSYQKLLKATDGFSLKNLVGRGSFGSVYRGILDMEEVFVAIKVLNLQTRGASKSFMIECEALRSLRHRNLVKIITSCSGVDLQGNEFKALVYEFMPNGSLERWLHSSPEEQNDRSEMLRLSLLERINIAIDVACALDYLHHWCEKPIIHCDLKPSNILLDADMVAHVGDFGLAKFLLLELIEATESSSIGFRGTIGHVAPEYGLGSEFSTNGDIYSFGILLLEMITGKSPTDNMFKEGLNLHNFASMTSLEHVKDIVDPLILEENEEATEAVMENCGGPTRKNIIEMCLVSVIEVGVACSVESPQARMSIKNVINKLNLIRNTLLRH